MNADDTQVSDLGSTMQGQPGGLTRQNEISTYLNFTQANILAQQQEGAERAASAIENTGNGEASGSSISAAEFAQQLAESQDQAHLSKAMSASSSSDDLHRSGHGLPPLDRTGNRSHSNALDNSNAKYSVGTPTPLPNMEAYGSSGSGGNLSNPNSHSKQHLTYSANSLDDSVGDYVIYDTQIREEYRSKSESMKSRFAQPNNVPMLDINAAQQRQQCDLEE